jgi:DNA polymerase III sliding clamp (beta) subunit (PCNA family)
MYATVEDLSYFLTKVVKTVLDVGKSEGKDPVVKMKIKKDRLTLECSTTSKGIRASMPVQVKEEGIAYLMASSLSSIKSSYKMATIQSKNEKIAIASKGKGRKFSITLNAVDKDKYNSFLDVNIKRIPKSSLRLSITALQGAISYIGINPIIIPGDEQSFISISTTNKITRIVIRDSYRLASLHVPSSTLKVDKELTTDFKELTNILNILSGISKYASIGYDDKLMSATGSNDDYHLQLLMNHVLPNVDIRNSTEATFNLQMKKKAIFTFNPGKDFKEAVENALAVGSHSGYVLMDINSNDIIITGSVPSSSYKESVSLDTKAIGEGKVKLGSPMLVDVLKLMADTPIIRVTDSACIIKSAVDRTISHFILPLLVVYDS